MVKRNLFNEVILENEVVALGLSTRASVDYLNTKGGDTEKHVFMFEVKVVKDLDRSISEVDMLISSRSVDVLDNLKFVCYIRKQVENGVLNVTSEIVSISNYKDDELLCNGNVKTILSLVYDEDQFTITPTGIMQLIFADYCGSIPDVVNTTNISNIFIPTPIIVDYSIDIDSRKMVHYWFDKERDSYFVSRPERLGKNLSCTERTWWSAKHGLNVSIENYVINGIAMFVSVARFTLVNSLDINYISSSDVIGTTVSLTLEIPTISDKLKEEGWKSIACISTPAECYREEKLDLFKMANSIGCEIDLFLYNHGLKEHLLFDISENGFPMFKELEPHQLEGLVQVSAASADYENISFIFQKKSKINIDGIRIEPIINNGFIYYVYTESSGENEVSLEDVLTIVKEPSPFKIVMGGI